MEFSTRTAQAVVAVPSAGQQVAATIATSIGMTE
jgi:hypothetical protein